MVRTRTFLLSIGVLCLGAASAFAQAQSPLQQKCIVALNKDAGLVGQTQGKENITCLKNAGKNKLVGTAQDCLTLDPKGKVLKKTDKTVADEGKICTATPGFGFTGAAATNSAALQGRLDLVADVFGTPLDSAVIDCAADKAGCICQQKVLKDLEKIAATKMKVFVGCKKEVLGLGATSAAALAGCVNDPGTSGSIADDPKAKVQKRVAKLIADVASKCVGVSSPFPGNCDTLSGPTLASCLDAQVECRVCQTINEADNLFVNCDLFDDGAANASCASGAGPTPTATETPAPGVVFQGALLQTSGRFTYQAIVGLTGADAECAVKYAGTHVCTYAELQTAEAAGDLDGAQDTDGVSVTSFWAIDGTRPDVDQCSVTVAWDYATAHTGHFADVVNLNNATGALGSLTTGNLCLAQHWVGCCL